MAAHDDDPDRLILEMRIANLKRAQRDCPDAASYDVLIEKAERQLRELMRLGSKGNPDGGPSERASQRQVRRVRRS